ncbi:MAG: Fic family protein [Eubacteriales bacterium]|nr:Fic family protein [Eubacteriales bacterium]
MITRAGTFVNTLNGYSAFIPKPLPPEPSIKIDKEMYELLSSADRKLGRLDGITEILPNPDLFVAMYVKKEALLSSQIEGTQASLIDVINAESNESGIIDNTDISEIVNYISAMKYGLARLKTLPLSLRLIKEIHGILLKDVRGSERSPGEFRNSQNWIGPAGCTLKNASFIPPTVSEMNIAMADLENFIHDNKSCLPPLIKIALIHAQFETIHPFLDGNGRMGRLLIAFWLCEQEILHQPLLYLSYYFKQNRTEYYDRLTAIRKQGTWEQWVRFFLQGIIEISDESVKSAKNIIAIKTQCHDKILSIDGGNSSNLKLLDYLFYQPVVTRKSICKYLDISYPTSGVILKNFVDMNILKDISPGKQRNKKYTFYDYLQIMEKGTH